MIAVSWPTLVADRLPRPFFMFAQAPSTALSSGTGGQLRLGQPVGVGIDEGTHRGADVGVQVVPHLNRGSVQLGVRGGDQASGSGQSSVSKYRGRHANPV